MVNPIEMGHLFVAIINSPYTWIGLGVAFVFLIIWGIRIEKNELKLLDRRLADLNREFGTNFIRASGERNISWRRGDVSNRRNAILFDLAARKIAVVRGEQGRIDVEVHDFEYLKEWECYRWIDAQGKSSYHIDFTFRDYARPTMRVQMHDKKSMEEWFARLGLILNDGISG